MYFNLIVVFFLWIFGVDELNFIVWGLFHDVILDIGLMKQFVKNQDEFSN